jgi:hypothetical protein
VRTAENYRWGGRDVIDGIVGFAIGALHTMDEGTNSYGCSENLTAMRTDLLQASEYFEDSTDELEGMTAIWEGSSHIDDWGMNCFYVF